MNYTLFLLEVYLCTLALYQRSNRPKVTLLPSSYFVVQYDGHSAKVDFHEPSESLDELYDGR